MAGRGPSGTVRGSLHMQGRITERPASQTSPAAMAEGKELGGWGGVTLGQLYVPAQRGHMSPPLLTICWPNKAGGWQCHQCMCLEGTQFGNIWQKNANDCHTGPNRWEDLGELKGKDALQAYSVASRAGGTSPIEWAGHGGQGRTRLFCSLSLALAPAGCTQDGVWGTADLGARLFVYLKALHVCSTSVPES